MKVTNTTGAVAPGKRQVNWRVRCDILVKLEQEAKAKGFLTIPQFLNHYFFERYFGESAK